MKIATWNVNGINARIDLIAHWLESRKPDVVALQELKCEEQSLPLAPITALGYNVWALGQKSWNGVAILARENAEVLQRGLEGQEEDGARLITVKIQDFTYTSVYCPNGKDIDHLDFAMKLRWFDSLTEYWRELTHQHENSLIGGDFNITPSQRDTWRGAEGNGKLFHTVEERVKLAQFVGTNLHDLFRELNPGSDDFSWWDYRGGSFEKDQGLRIDMIYGTASMRARTRKVEIDREYRNKINELTPSDHVPVIVELEE